MSFVSPRSPGIRLCLLAGGIALGACSSSDQPSNNADAAAVPEADGGTDASTTSPTLEAFLSGTRLKAMYEDGGGGAVALRQWHDTVLNVDCEFSRDVAGALRCMPVAQVAPGFSDAACTERVQVIGGTPPSFMSVQLETCIGLRRREGFSVGGVVTTPNYYTISGDTCVEDLTPPPGTRYELVPVEESTFVAATENTFVVDSGLSITMAEGADGSREALSMVESASDVACQRNDLDIGTLCVPGDMSYEFGYYTSDGTCSSPLAYSTGATSCEAARYALRYTEGTVNGCPGYQRSLHVVSGAHEGDVFASNEGVCELVNTGSSRFWRAGALAAPTAMPQLVDVQVGSGRLKATYTGTTGGTALKPRSFWHDSATGRVCVPTETVSAGRRCLPQPASDSSGLIFKADPGCVTPVVRNRRCTSADPQIELERVGGEATVAYELGAVHGGLLYVGGPGNCTEIPRDELYDHFLLAASIDFEDFAEVVSRQDL